MLSVVYLSCFVLVSIRARAFASLWACPVVYPRLFSDPLLWPLRPEPTLDQNPNHPPPLFCGFVACDVPSLVFLLYCCDNFFTPPVAVFLFILFCYCCSVGKFIEPRCWGRGGGTSGGGGGGGQPYGQCCVGVYGGVGV